MKRIVYQGGIGEIVEKKSRFIASVLPVKTEEEALQFIAAKKKEYWDARHNCYAYIIGKNQEVMRCSDDGEPAQTAGRPMLDVLLNEEVCDVVVVVTRYFGGVLLGTGGLVRAYQGATKAGLAASVLVEQQQGVQLEITTDYTGYGKVEYIIREEQVAVLDTSFEADVKLSVIVEQDKKERIAQSIADKTNGCAKLEWGDVVLFGEQKGQIIIFS